MITIISVLCKYFSLFLLAKRTGVIYSFSVSKIIHPLPKKKVPCIRCSSSVYDKLVLFPIFNPLLFPVLVQKKEANKGNLFLLIVA